jgi:hypothetical protein
MDGTGLASGAGGTSLSRGVHVGDDPEFGTETGGLEGRYANYFQVGHNAFEFVLEFGQLYGGDALPALHTRIITNPVYCQELLRILGDALDAYRRAFGDIPRASGGRDSDD